MAMIQPNGDGRPRERAVLYDRVSGVIQATNYSTGEQGFQHHISRAHSERKRYLVVGAKSDVDSGKKHNIKGLNEALEMARRREFEVLVVADTDRFARSLGKKILFEEWFRECGVRVEFVNLPLDDTAEGRLAGNVFGAFAQYEHEKIVYRLANGKLSKARNGEYVGQGGLVPYGYVPKPRYSAAKRRDVIIGLVIDPETGAVVVRIYHLALTLSVLDIAATLDREGVPPPGRARQWRFATVYNILTNPVYRGVAYFGRDSGRLADRETGEAIRGDNVPAIVSEEAWARARAAMVERRVTRRGRARGVGQAADAYTLRGMLTCDHCGGALCTAGESRGYRAYRCLRGKPSLARADGREPCALHLLDAGALEEEAWGWVLALLWDADRLKRGLERDREAHAAGRAERAAGAVILGRAIEKQEKRMRRALEEKLAVEGDDEQAGELGRLAAEAADTLRRLRADAAEYAAEPAEGVTEEEARSLERFAARVRGGLAEASEGGGAERRRMLQLVGLRGRVRRAEAPRRGLGWAVTWRARLLHSEAAGGGHSDPRKFLLELLCPPDGGEPLVRLRRESLP